MDGFPIVSVLGSCCLGVGLCQLLPSMLINVIISSYILPHSPTFTETISDELRLMPPPAFTAVISAPPGQSSSSAAEVCTALPHLSQVQGTLVLFPRDGLQSWGCQIRPRLGSNPGTAGLQSGTLSIELPHPQIELPHPPIELPHPQSYHIPIKTSLWYSSDFQYSTGTTEDTVKLGLLIRES